MRFNTWFDRATDLGRSAGAIAAIIAAVAGIIGLIIMIVFAWAFIVAGFLVLVATIAMWWAFGGKVTVKVNGRPVGYLRWMTYHRLHEHKPDYLHQVRGSCPTCMGNFRPCIKESDHC